MDILQPALPWPPPSTDAETHLRLMADTGTVVHPLKLGEPEPTINVHVLPFIPRSISQVSVAVEPPGIVLPGLFAVKEMVRGIARRSLT